MRSTFAGFTIAQQAMNASQRALEVTGQNIANINTKGYTRQELDIVSLNLNGANKVSTTVDSKIGYGVEITGISQVRDPFLDVLYRNQMSPYGTTCARQGILDQLANIFDETGASGVKSSITGLSSALTSLLDNASSGDSTVLQKCQDLVSYIHQKSKDLTTLREETITGLEDTDIPAVNNLLSEIGKLNESIWNSKANGNPGLELQDQRNSMIDTLAGYLPISVSYKQVAISSNNAIEVPVIKFAGSDGKTYNLTAGEHGENVAALSLERNKGTDGNDDGTVSISLTPASDYLSNASDYKVDITDHLEDGTIKGTVDMLNKSGPLDYPETDYKGIGYYEKTFDAFVQSFAETFNELNTNTTPYTGASAIPASGTIKEFTSTGSEHAEYSISFANTSGNFLEGETLEINGQSFTFGDGTGTTIAIGSDLNGSMSNLLASLNTTLKVNTADTTGTWTYNSGTLKWKSDTAVTSGDTIDSSSIKDASGNTLSVTYKANPSNIEDYDLFKTSDGSKTFTAGNIKISDDWINQKIHLITTKEDNAGSDANNNLVKMLNAIDAKREFKYDYTYTDDTGAIQNGSVTINNNDFYDFYTFLEGVQGQESKTNTSTVTNYSSLINATEDGREAVSGVSLDEEGVNLLQYQRTYAAAARLMTTLDEALDILINNTGVVGR